MVWRFYSGLENCRARCGRAVALLIQHPRNDLAEVPL